MIDIKLIREDPSAYRQAAKVKGFKVDIDELLAADKQLLEVRRELQDVKTAQNTAGEYQEFQQNQRFVEDWDYLYGELLSYCSSFVTYGAETCLDWTDFVLGNPFATPGPHFSTIQDCAATDDLATSKNYGAFTTCLENAGVPLPYY